MRWAIKEVLSATAIACRWTTVSVAWHSTSVGRPWLVWDAEFKREKIGEMPTEMFLHFFKSLSDAAKMNLNIKAEGQNEHHKIEGIFKALARALKMAVRRDIYHYESAINQRNSIEYLEV